jgi:ribosomal protein S18 acetylase RimI-like enzyme
MEKSFRYDTAQYDTASSLSDFVQKNKDFCDVSQKSTLQTAKAAPKSRFFASLDAKNQQVRQAAKYQTAHYTQYNAAQYRWWKADEIQKLRPEMFLRAREPFCVAACSRFLQMSYLFDKMWVFSSGGDIGALLFQSNKTLYPVFGAQIDVKMPVFMHRLLQGSPIHAIQGLRGDTAIMEELLVPLGVFASARVDFDLLSMDNKAFLRRVGKLSAGITLRVPTAADIDEMVPMQASYNAEEVLRTESDINRAVCRSQVEHIINHEKIIVACKDGRIIGKVNTNAQSYSRYQIGGVFVEAAYRNLGIAQAMTEVFCNLLLSEGKGLTLFVRKQNAAASKVYRKIGFSKTADYRIVYT